jgi:hypothetical protein
MTIAAANPSGMSSSTSHASWSENTLDAVGGRPGPGLGSGIEALLALDPEPDQRADHGAELDLLVGQVAEMRDLDVAGDVLMHGQRIDDPNGVVLA